MQQVSPKPLVYSPPACARNTYRFLKWNCIWPLCRSIRPCSRSGKYIIVSCNISLGDSLFKLVSIGWTCFIYLGYDVAPKEVVWYCKIRRVGGPAPEAPDFMRNLKPCLPSKRRFHSDSHQAKVMFGATTDTEQISVQFLRRAFPRRIISRCANI